MTYSGLGLMNALNVLIVKEKEVINRFLQPALNSNYSQSHLNTF